MAQHLCEATETTLVLSLIIAHQRKHTKTVLGLCGDGRNRFSVVYWLHASGIGIL